MIIREKYLSKIRPFYDQDLIKVIMGVRRCGKSCLLYTSPSPRDYAASRMPSSA